MSPIASKVLDDLTKQYVAAQFPGRESFMFQPEAHEEVAFNELRARGFIERYTTDSFRFTDAAIDFILQNRTPTPVAEKAFAGIARLYIEAGYPEVGCWSFGADGDEEAALSELRDRGLVERYTSDSWRLTDYGQAVIMEKFAA